MLTSLSLVFERSVYKHFEINSKIGSKLTLQQTAWFLHWWIKHNSTPYDCEKLYSELEATKKQYLFFLKRQDRSTN